MPISINKVLIALVFVGGVVWLASRTEENVPSIDEQVEKAEQSANSSYLAGEASTPLANSNATLSTLVAQNRRLRNDVESMREEQRQTEEKMRRLEREKGSGEDVSPQVNMLQSKIDQLEDSLKNAITRMSEQPDPEPENVETDNDIAPIDITGSDIAPIDVEGSINKPKKTNPILDTLVQPDKTFGANDGMENPQPQITRGDMVVVKQSDVQYTEQEDGTVVQTYPINPQQSTAGVSSEVEGVSSQASNGDDEEVEDVPIYTVPANATLFGSFSMTAVIGRVPIDNSVSNPFRFKVVVGNDNLATNGLFMPQLAEMSLSGYAEGDFTMECARGTIDTATFTFHDGTIRTVRSSDDKPLGSIADDAGVPCIAGQYITNFPSYAATQGGLATLAGIAGAFAESAVTTTTADNGTTTEVINDGTKKAFADGAEAGTAEIQKWYAERQSSAFDAVYLPPGTPLNINIEQEMKVDYAPEGRKLFHASNAEEYLGW